MTLVTVDFLFSKNDLLDNTYTLIENLHCNNYRSVLKVKNTFSNDITILKLFNITNDLVEIEYLNETNNISLAHHDGIIKIKNYTIQPIQLDGEKFHYFTTSYYPSGTLASFNLESISITEKYRLIINIIDSLDNLYKNKICHRDLKPENIFITVKNDEIRPIIGDFGNSIKFSLNHIESFQYQFHYADLYNFAKIVVFILTGIRFKQKMNTIPLMHQYIDKKSLNSTFDQLTSLLNLMLEYNKWKLFLSPEKIKNKFKDLFDF